ncbi:hypothetical protein CWC38_04010 [Kocuria tytonicola]|uniref:hypothetical protein n=1 Tax=Kocuria tytonicola TaxID=2055946 RepID=UPI000EF8F4DC|nr:hypothetical protein [Kocuria tytonicola]RLZ03779.1 hypothetical protein CWC38_04010 [Kocuria tytonicola]
MGLRDLFRSTKHDAPTPQPSPGARPTEPGRQSPLEQHPAGHTAEAGHAQDAERRPPERETTPLPEKGALTHLVELLLSRGADRARLTLVQSGNIMTHQTRQSVGEGEDEVENGTVDQGSPLFDDVADLYTQAMSTPVGPWRQLDLVVAAPDDGRRDVTVSYDYPSGESRTEHFTHGHAGVGGTRDAAGTPNGTAHGLPEDHTADDVAAGSGTAAAAHQGTDLRSTDRDAAATDEPASSTTADRTAAPVDEAALGTHERHDVAEDAVRVVDEHGTQPAESGDVVAGTRTAPEHSLASESTGSPESHGGGAALAGTAAGAGLAGAGYAAPQQDGADSAGETAAAEDTAHVEDTPAPGDGLPAEAHGDHHDQDGAHGTVPGEVDPQDRAGGSDELPAHVDESAFGTDTAEPLVPAGATMDPEDDPSGAPQLATATDVSPSYRAPEAQPELDPDALAPGNLVLTTGDVLGRLADAQRHLFGENGTARDVSTVLIRVRALGTYYDALTHVRLNGFWDQRPTFDLVPEDQLKVQELKDDSYVEGSGAPLAMMFRFRPGVPPELTFDYSDEEAFVRYEQRLPGQNYLEELRMYPRTGSNIPQHVNEALQDWNY